MACQPVALQCRDERLDPIIDIRRQGSKSHSNECGRDDKCPQAFIFYPPFKDEIEEDNGPGKKDQGLIEV
jgi:hypothetical protein